MGRFNVRPEKETALIRRMDELGILETDLVEKFVRSGGPGGQHRNKTSSCVYLKHVPTGLEVKMQEDRSQSINRFLARRVLVEKIESRVLNLKTRTDLKRGKIKKQKSRRKRRSMRKDQKKTSAPEGFAQRRCVPCEGGMPPWPLEKAEAQLKDLPGWRLDDEGKRLIREYTMKNFMAAVSRIQEIAAIAEAEGHHPDLHLTGYRTLRVELSTHAIRGLSDNDFILAAKIESLPRAQGAEEAGN